MRPVFWLGVAAAVCSLGCSAASGSGRDGDSGGSNANGSGAASNQGAQGALGGSAVLMLPEATSGSVSGVGGSDACIDVSVKFERVTPTVLLLIDQSHTMVIPFEPGATGRSRWNTVRDVLMDPTSGLVPRLQDAVRFGLTLYSAKTPEMCPALTEVQIGLGNYQAIKDAYTGQEPLDNTPTSESLEAAAKELAAYGEPGPKVIVLATDGNPDNCGNLDDNNNPDGGAASKALVIAAAERAFAQGISTYVISVGDEAAEAHLTNLAKAGRGGAPDATFYRALETETLVSAFNSILNGVLTCDFTLNGTVLPKDAPRGSVQLDDMSLTYRDENGWDMPDSGTVQLHGAACERAKQSADHLAIQFPCGTIVPK